MGFKKENSGMATVLTVALGTFMCSFDANAVNMALPLMQRSFNSTIAAVEWVAVAYLLALSASLLAFGRLADMVGHKRLYVAGFIGFTASSLFSALSLSIESLIVARILQGLSASLMMASANALIVSAVAPARRGRALGMTAVAVALASCAGPALGGLLATAFGWKSIFLVNLPIGVVGTLLSLRAIGRDDARAPGRFDPLGAVLIVGALVSLLLSLDMFSNGDAGSAAVWILLLAGIVLGGLFVLSERRAASPLLPLRLFANRVFAAGNLAALLFYLSLFIMVFLGPYFLQGLRGLSPSASGLMMLPMSAALMIAAPASGALSDRFDSRWLSCGGMMLVALGEFLFGTFTAATPAWLVLGAFALTGIGLGTFQTPNNSAVMGNVPADARGVGGATLATTRNLGMALGEAVSAALLATCMASRGFTLSLSAASGEAGWSGAFSYAIRVTCVFAATAALAAGLLSLARSQRSSSFTS